MKENEYLIQINYKSGLKERFWTTSFNMEYISGGIGRISCVFSNHTNKSLHFGIDEIESVWQKGIRCRLFGITIWQSIEK